VLGGGALFAAFPLVYASLFSGFYLAMMLVLLVLILRTVAIEFRSKRESERWRSTWDWFFTISSLGITVLLGVAFGNVIQGVPIDQDGNMDVDLVALLNPYALALGVTAVVMFCLHGGIFLTLKTEGELLQRVKHLVPRLMMAFFVLTTILIVWTLLLDKPITDRYFDRLWIGVFPLLALAAVLVAWREIGREHYLSAFLASGTTIALLLGTVAAGLYPVLLPSSTDEAYDLTVSNASSAQPTLEVMTIIAAIGIPFVLLYTAGVYYFFRGRVVLDDESY
jgi:cytochrome d ubiquinol oxidase subunit II